MPAHPRAPVKARLRSERAGYGSGRLRKDVVPGRCRRRAPARRRRRRAPAAPASGNNGSRTAGRCDVSGCATTYGRPAPRCKKQIICGAVCRAAAAGIPGRREGASAREDAEPPAGRQQRQAARHRRRAAGPRRPRAAGRVISAPSPRPSTPHLRDQCGPARRRFAAGARASTPSGGPRSGTTGVPAVPGPAEQPPAGLAPARRPPASAPRAAPPAAGVPTAAAAHGGAGAGLPPGRSVLSQDHRSRPATGPGAHIGYRRVPPGQAEGRAP